MANLSYADMPCPAAEMAEFFTELDQKTLKHRHIKYLGYICYAGEQWKIVFGEKYLLKDAAQNLIGIVTQFDDFTGAYLFDIGRFLLDSSRRYAQKNTRGQFCCTIEPHYLDIRLSERQSTCLFFWLRGKSAREIGGLLNLSVRTVEGYIEQIKNKLHCFTKSQLIEKAIHLGYLNVIPESVLGTLHLLK